MATSAAARCDSFLEEPGHRVRVLVVDGEELVHWGFRLLLSGQEWVERCLPAGDADTALDLATRFEPQLALVGLASQGPRAEHLCRELTKACPRMRLLLLTSAEAVPTSTLRAYGAVGHVSRAWGARDLLRVIRMVSVGQPANAYRPARRSSLSARQQEILQLIAAGETNTEIARRLYLSRHTVKQHTSALYRKLGVRSRMHAVQVAQRQGLIAV